MRFCVLEELVLSKNLFVSTRRKMLAVAVILPTENPCTDVYKMQLRLRPPIDTGGIISMCNKMNIICSGLKSRRFVTYRVGTQHDIK